MGRKAKTRMEEQKSYQANQHHMPKSEQIKKMLSMVYTDPFSVPKEVIPEGVVYKWIKMSVLNVPDEQRLPECMRRGWEPVPSSRHPEMVSFDIFGRQKQYEGYITRGGLILCERHEELCKLEEDAINKRNAEIIRSMPGTENFMGEPTIPGRYIQNETSYSYGISPEKTPTFSR